MSNYRKLIAAIIALLFTAGATFGFDLEQYVAQATVTDIAMTIAGIVGGIIGVERLANTPKNPPGA